MKPATSEWVAKAEGDFATAGREIRARKMPNYDATCFHCLQCAEKYLKAVLQENETRIPKIHNLLELSSSTVFCGHAFLVRFNGLRICSTVRLRPCG